LMRQVSQATEARGRLYDGLGDGFLGLSTAGSRGLLLWILCDSIMH
jgi:hypothetical protein